MKRMIRLALGVAVIALLSGWSAAEDAPRNLIANSSFELLDADGVPGQWNAAYAEDAIRVDPTNAPHGRICLHLQLDGRETLIGQHNYFELTPGKQMTLSAHVKTKDLEPASKFQIEIINVGWSFGYTTFLPITRATADWQRYSKTFVVPAAGQFKYQGADNVLYKAVIYAKGVSGQVWVDGLQLEEGDKTTAYSPMEATGADSGDPIFDAIAAGFKGGTFRRSKYFEVKDPLFEELLGDEPGPDRVLYYGYEDLWVDELDRPYAKKFGHRHVLHEQLARLESGRFVAMTNAWRRGGVGTYPTMRLILRHDVQGVAPKMFGDHPWIMDPRWQETFVQTAVKLARQSLDDRPGNIWGNSWGLWAGDEVFESAGIKVPPKDKRYDEIHAIDREVREKFGFGKYGIPDSADDKDPFKRIAFRRWVNAKLTETFKKATEAVKKINPKLVMLGPNPCGAVPPVDLEAMTPYFDLISSQSWSSPDAFTQKVATGADVKALTDLSACPVWAFVQHAAAFDPEAVREQYSQVFRNGGEGLAVLGVPWYDRELEHVQHTNPPKWRAILETIDVATKMNKVKLPKPDTAILYASDTFLTLDSVKMSSPEHPQMYTAYAALGPCVGSWFSFVSDRQIVRGLRDLSEYKALYIPYAKYQRAAVLEKIEQYAKRGGIVVCTDPHAFTWDVSGDDLSAKWSAITGTKQGKDRTGRATASFTGAGIVKVARPLAVTFPGPGREMTISDQSVKPLAVFGDGTPAAAIRSYGKGHVICFASDPFASRDRHSPIIETVRTIQKAAGAKAGRDIWRFKLPPFKTVDVEDPHKGLVCLTDNHVVLKRNEPASTQNLATGGTYTYDRFPTGIADAAESGQIPFASGHLTNRKAAFAARKRGGERNPASIEKWIVSWKDPEPVALTVDLQKPRVIDRIKIFYSGVLAPVNVEGSADAAQWETLADLPQQPATADVIDASIPVDGKHRHLRLRLAARNVNVPMELVELEIWGVAPKGK